MAPLGSHHSVGAHLWLGFPSKGAACLIRGAKAIACYHSPRKLNQNHQRTERSERAVLNKYSEFCKKLKILKRPCKLLATCGGHKTPFFRHLDLVVIYFWKPLDISIHCWGFLDFSFSCVTILVYFWAEIAYSNTTFPSQVLYQLHLLFWWKVWFIHLNMCKTTAKLSKKTT